MISKFIKGSEWRKWDLHVHTASSFDTGYKGPDADDLLVKAWCEHEFAAVAITDHHKIDSERIARLRAMAPNITIFPGFEIRTDTATPNLHLVGIFPETKDLQELQEDFNSVLIRPNRKDGETNQDLFRKFSNIVEFTKQRGGILTIHAGNKSNGIDKEIKNVLPVERAIKREIADHIDIFEVGRIDDIEGYRTKVFPHVGEKPLIICSDNHDPRYYQLKECLWIKADPTFQGLIQTILHPSERVYVGTIPPKIEQFSKNKNAYIQSVTMSRVDKPKHNRENWFDTSIDLNPTLVAIIGNKGSGKSALSDVIGHLCKSKNIEHASFLTKDRFHKENKSSDYTSGIHWCDGTEDLSVPLDSKNRTTSLEHAQYLPQKFIEKVCNDLERVFQKEIDNVIFSYVDPAERGESTDLDELIEIKSTPILTRIVEIKSRLQACNDEIIRLENRLTKAHKQEVSDKLQQKQKHLESHRKSKPEEISKPNNVQDVQYTEKLESIKKQIAEFEKQEKTIRDELHDINIKIDSIKKYGAEVQVLTEKIDSLNQQLIEFGDQYDIASDLISINCTTPLDFLNKQLTEAETKRNNLRKTIEPLAEGSNETIASKILKLRQDMSALVANVDNAEKSYQKYLSDLDEWKKTETSITGAANQEDSIRYFEHELKMLDGEVLEKYHQSCQERRNLIKGLFEQKKLIANIYKEIYKPIEIQLEPLLRDSDEVITFDVNVSLVKRDMAETLLSHINQKISGVFSGKLDGLTTMREMIDSTNFDDINSVIGFVDKIFESVVEGDFDKSNKRIKSEKKDFYNTLASLDYIDAEYSLSLGGRNLQILSAGERGVVLMVFYLALSKKNIPLIIDQPEDNLDNQSVFSRLVPCIREAKKKRQVIIVTHNPNIAIACDAEQIICCSINKSDNHITYESGSIENPDIRSRVVDILEGTMPAFELRRLKYTYELYGQK